MPAVISIEGGADNGRAFQIEEEVVRIGRSPGSQIILTDPSAPPTAVAVRYQGGKYVVYNRSTETINIAGVSISKDQSRPWTPGEAVSAWPGAILQLTISGNPAPARRVMGVASNDLGTDKPAVPEVTTATATTTTAKASGAKSGQIIVIAMTWLVILGVLAYTLLAPDESDSVADEARYVKLAADLDAAAKGGNPLVSVTAEKIKEARMTERRGHKSAARKAYGDIVVQLQNRPPVTKPETRDPLLDRAQEFARSRIRSLTEEE